MDHLRRIIDQKRQRVEVAKQSASQRDVEFMAFEVRKDATPRRLRAALANNDRINIIAEFKRRSPSKGDIRGHANPETIAQDYERGGAAGISVLTEEDFFGGSLDDLRTVRRATSLPILRKDFIFDPYQVYESAAAGADAVLLIAAVLDDDELRALRRVAETALRMDALVEVHTRAEMDRAIAAGAKIVGVNNRNLATFEVTLQTSLDLATAAGNDALLISESGIETSGDIRRLRDAGYHGFLIGETLMKADSPENLLRQFTETLQAVSR